MIFSFQFHGDVLTANEYDQSFGNLHDYEGQARFLARLIDQRSQTPVHVIDVGCGTGKLLSRASTLATHADFHMVGVDPYEPFIEHCRNLSIKNASFTCCTLEVFETEPGTVDLVVCGAYLLQSIQDETTLIWLLEKMRRWLAPNGRIVWSFRDELLCLQRFVNGSFPIRLLGSEWEGQGYEELNGSASQRRLRLRFTNPLLHKTIEGEAVYLVLDQGVITKLLTPAWQVHFVRGSEWGMTDTGVGTWCILEVPNEK